MCRRVQTATVLAYGLTVLLVFGTATAYASLGAALSARNPYAPSRPPAALLYLNPFVLTGSVIGGDTDVAAEDQGFGNGAMAFDDFGNPVQREEPVNSPFRMVREAKKPQTSVAATATVGPAFDRFGGPMGPNGPMELDANGNWVDPVEGEDEFGADTRFDTFVPLSLAALTGLGVLSIWLASRRLRTPTDRER